MKQIRWRDLSLVSKIVIEVGMIAVLLYYYEFLFICFMPNFIF